MSPNVLLRSETRTRGARALVVTLLVALLLGGGSGFVAAADSGDTQALDAFAAAFGTPEPRIGDRGVYTKEQVYLGDEDHGVDDPEIEFAHFEWIEHAPLWDAEGTPRHVVGLRFLEDPVVDHPSFFSPRAVNLTWLVDPDTQHAVAARGETESSRTLDVERILQPDDEEEHRSDEAWVELPLRQRPEPEPLFCGMLHALQGATRDVRDGVALLPECRLDNWGGPPADTLYRPEGLARIGDTTTLVLHAPPAGDDEAENASQQYWRPFTAFAWDWRPTQLDQRIWLSPDNPYPLRIESYNPHSEYRETYRLVAFERGDDPFPPPAGLPAPLPAPVSAPMMPWGPDDSDITHPYPLAEAFQNARDDPSYPDLRALLEDHPDAKVTRAVYGQAEGDATQSAQWSFTVWGGRTLLTVCAYKEHTTTPGSLLPAGTAGAARHETCHETATRPLDWAVFPSTLPTLASLMAIHDTIFETEGGPRSYGFTTFCPADFGRPVDPCTYRFTIGNEQTEEGQDPSPLDGARDTSGTRQSVVITETGRLVRYDNVSWSIQPKEDPPPSGDEADQTLATLATSTPVWVMPQPAPMVGAALLALLSGALYWFWPTLKSGMMAPLFTRIRRNRALDHPTRHELHTLISAEPGVHIQELVRRTGRPEGTVRHHLGRLVDAGLVQMSRTAGFTCCYPTGPATQPAAEQAAVLKSEGAQAVLQALIARPGATGAQISTTTGLTRQTVAYHLDRLRSAGLVTRDAAAKGAGYRATATPDAPLSA